MVSPLARQTIKIMLLRTKTRMQWFSVEIEILNFLTEGEKMWRYCWTNHINTFNLIKNLSEVVDDGADFELGGKLNRTG